MSISARSLIGHLQPPPVRSADSLPRLRGRVSEGIAVPMCSLLRLRGRFGLGAEAAAALTKGRVYPRRQCWPRSTWMTNAAIEAFHAWHDFFVLLGTGAATLIGAMFV